MPIGSLDTALYRIGLPVPLSDSTHSTMTHFELVTVRRRDNDGAEGVGYTYTTGAAGTAVHARPCPAQASAGAASANLKATVRCSSPS